MLRISKTSAFALCMVATFCAVQYSLAQDSGNESAEAVEKQIEAMLTAQVDRWNEGDIDGFMQSYWKSEDLTFSSGGTTRHGWDETRERYRKRYPTPDRMGKLTFSELEVRSLGDASAMESRAALVLGEWALERDEDPIGGNFTLVVEKKGGHWVITHDHSSQRAE